MWNSTIPRCNSCMRDRRPARTPATRPTSISLHRDGEPMKSQPYDVVVIGTGAGGVMAIKTLCEAGLKVCALNAGRRLDPEKDFRNHRMTWEMKYRGFGDPKTRMKDIPDFLDSEYNQGAWEHDLAYTVAPGTQWMWP